MPKRIQLNYSDREVVEVGKFAAALKETATKESGVFDSAAASDFMSTIQNQADTGITVPKDLQVVLDEVGDEGAGRVTQAMLDGIRVYEEQHGVEAPADVIRHAIHLGYGTTTEARRKFALDSASSAHHDQISLQPNRAVVAIMSAIAEAVPIAHYLPADVGSNEARLAILSHNAGNAFGLYGQGAIMDGISSGDPYITSSRINTSKPAVTTGNVTGKITKIQTTADTCDANAGDTMLLRGRSLVYVNGRVAAKEVESTGSGNSAVSGSIVVGGTSYTIGGTINTDTGVYALTTTPAMPVTVDVVVEGFIDYERAPTLVPSIISAVNTYSIYAKPWRVNTRQTIDSRTQMANELGLDPYSESVYAIQTQFANERHYDAIRKGVRLGANNVQEFDFDLAAQRAEKSRAEIWQDFSYPLGAASQQMAEDTMNHGITHLYVGKRVAAQYLGLPSTVFQPSGVAARPGIYRLGTLFGQYEVYYTPKGLVETEDGAQILAAGRATDVARNPIVFGDAVAPTVLPLSVGDDLRQGAGFYARNFSSVNPHDPSARGFALINVTNM